MPPPMPTTEARSGSGSLEPGRSANMRHPAGHAARRPDVRHRHQTDVKQTDVRQHHRGHNKHTIYKKTETETQSWINYF